MQVDVYHKQTGDKQTVDIATANRLTAIGGEYTHTKPLPAGWDRETPRYRATRALEPALQSRFRYEKPFSRGNADGGFWQYGEQPISEDEVIETTAWPHDSFEPLNESAKQIKEHFMTRERSRMTLSPWSDGKLWLNNGLDHDNPPALNRRDAVSAVPPVGGRRRSRGVRPRVA